MLATDGLSWISAHPLQSLAALCLLPLFVHILPWLYDPYGLRKYPGPWQAALSDFYLASFARKGKRYEGVHKLHDKYGTYVRIAPNHLSIADPDALASIYGHGTGSLKSNFYDAFVSLERGLFNTRDRAQHTRKRKIISHTFSPNAIKDFEPYVAQVVEAFLAKWDEKCERAAKAGSNDGWWLCDSLLWLNILAFEVIGSLAFGAPFGMLERESDIAIVEAEDGSQQHLPAVKILNERGEYSATQGALPPWIRPYTRYLDPWFARGLASVQNLAGIARNRVNRRLAEGAGERKDLLARLQAGRDDKGEPMGKTELTAEALTQLCRPLFRLLSPSLTIDRIAGSDTTSNSSCAILFFIAKHPDVQQKLVKELADRFGGHFEGVMDHEQVKDLPYLNACINEGLRRHSTSSIGLPRIITQPTDFKGEHLVPGQICSVPSYTIHHSPAIWEDPFSYRPERWLGEKGKELDKYFVPFGVGPRSCVGRNVAFLELQVFISTIINRYEIRPKDLSIEELPTSEGFLRKPLESWLFVRRRGGS